MTQDCDKRQVDYGQQGFALVLAMALVLVISLITVAGMNTSVGGKWRSANYLAARQAQYSAEAGVQDGVARLIAGTISDPDTTSQSDINWNAAATYTSGDFTNSFSVRHLVNNGAVVKDLSGLPYYQITSTGYEGASKGARKTIQAVVSLRQERLFTGAMTGCNGISAVGRASVDSYDSTQSPDGEYHSEMAHSNGSLSTCVAGSNISLTQNVDIRGNVTATGTVTTAGGVNVIGTVTSGAPASECDPVDVATYVDNHRPAGTPTALTLEGGATTITAPGSYYYSGITLSGQASLALAGSGNVTMFIDGDFSITGQGLFTIPPGVKLTIYITGSASLAGNGVRANGPPTNLIVYSSNTGSNAVSYTGNEAFSGAVYAPLGTVSMGGNAVFNGAVRGRVINDGGNAAFHYDEALGKMPVGGILGYTMVNWKEIFN